VLTIDLVAAARCGRDAGFQSSVAIRTENWDGDHAHPTALLVEGLWLRRADLSELVERVRAWTKRPLDQLDATRLDGTFELARLPGQRLSITFGARSDTVAHHNPVASALVAINAFSCEFHFVTDQSCLTLFACELGNLLHGA